MNEAIISANDSGPVNLESPTLIGIGVLRGRVALELHHPMKSIELEPENARLLGEALAKAAYHARYGTPAPVFAGSTITGQKRKRIIDNAVFRMKRMENRAPEFIAADIVDLVLTELT